MSCPGPVQETRSGAPGGRRSFFGCLVAWLILGLAGGGCWVKKEVGQRLQADITALQAELGVVKDAHQKQKQQLRQRIEEADRRIAELVKIIEDYRRAMGRSAADFGVDIDRLREELMGLKGRVEVLEYELGRLKQASQQQQEKPPADQDGGTAAAAASQPATTVPTQPADPLAAIKRPEKKEAFYKLAHGLLEAGQTAAARQLFKEFLAKWPDDAYSDNALYWIGESYYAEGDFRLAALTFQKVRTGFPKGDKAGDALLKLGYCFYSMGRYQQALPFLEKFVQDHPRSSLVAQAKKKIREARRLARKKKSSRRNR